MKDNTIKNLVALRQNLKTYLDPKILQKLVEFIEATGNDHSMIERYVWFSENSENGSDCRYAQLAKEFFLQNQSKGVAEIIIWLYYNFARQYDKRS